MLDYRVDTLLMVCKYMNFTKAAEKLCITQPAVSQHIRYWEEKYGIKIFEFEGKKMKLSREGEMLLNSVMTIKHDNVFLHEKIKELQTGQHKLVFGATLTIGEFVIPRRIAAYLNKYPEASVKMVVSNTHDLLKKIDNDEIAFALIEGYFTRNEYDYLPYSKERYIAICGSGYQFSEKKETIEDMLSENLIIREPGSGTREILERLLGEKNLVVNDFKNVVEIGNMNAIKSLVESNCGITFLYEVAAAEEIKMGRLKEVKLSDCSITHDFTFVWRKGSIFADRYKEVFKELKL